MMGQAKGNPANQVMSTGQREVALGSDPFAPAFDIGFGMVNAVFSKAGGVNHELIGFDFEAGVPVGMNVLVVERTEDVARLRAEMLERWPLVAHVFEAWAAPDASVAPSAHAQRYDVVNVALYTSDMAAVAICRVDVEKQKVVKGDLIFPDQIGGRLGRVLPTRH